MQQDHLFICRYYLKRKVSSLRRQTQKILARLKCCCWVERSTHRVMSGRHDLLPTVYLAAACLGNHFGFWLSNYVAYGVR